ncbi:hypothetical protein BTN50_1212 [Candidatus Enterovibrio altilux]|uniref:Uncharacterized protein n=1 Tax=Candidatus Enterovibrio altilux TaxID=1927128 RepID=A0A291B9P2_9GAMM|nr:hypothetical protein BTN50_1212 [Candidatus Enterovibrio luxaltus]
MPQLGNQITNLRSKQLGLLKYAGILIIFVTRQRADSDIVKLAQLSLSRPH